MAVTITGSYLTGATSVTFGGVPGTNLQLAHGTLTVTTPAATASGPVDVQVHTPYAGSASTDQSVFTYGIVDFHILAGTGSGAWNSPTNPVRAYVGEVVRFFNDDSIAHRLHSGGSPGPHWPADVYPGETHDWSLSSTCTCTTDPPQLYDHDQNPLTSGFYIVVTDRPT